MGMDDPSKDPRKATGRGADDSDRTLSAGGPGGAAAGQIGPYRLLEVIGEGGMGEVWLAEQKTPIHRTVALKLIKAGMDTKTVVARFESERQALALMDHPNIAQVYDAGATAEGRPYFVMEYVPGLPITEYCDKHRLTMQQRLELFQQVCDGVQHAHQKAIIHRDLKPSNVLVVEQGDKPVPKIIDFGLAKAMAQRLTDKTFFTEMGVLVGTPEYMSPEQADLREQNVDTRTDVYSLGVILYELLVGALPFDAKRLRAAGLEAILRVIREVEPPKPSTKVRSMGEGSAETAEKRREEPRSFARHLQGELDWITLKALEKDRTRRYGTASELAADIARHLRNEPVVAGPATAGYRIKKYAARHKFGLSAAAAAAVLLAGFVVAQAVELHRIRLERDRANRERDRANRITDFMTGMFKVSDPSEARGNSVTAREILDKASTQIDTGLAKDPELQAQMMYSMAVVYANLDLYGRAHSLSEKALDIRRRTLGPENPDTIASMSQLGVIVYDQGDFQHSEKLERETVDVSSRVLGRDNPHTLDSMHRLSLILWQAGHFAEAEKFAREAMEGRKRVLGTDNQDTLNTMGLLSGVLQSEGKYPEAEKVGRQALEVSERVFDPESTAVMGSRENLAIVLWQEGHYTEAEAMFRKNVETVGRIYGPEHATTLESVSNLAGVLSDEGRYPEAEKLFREALETERRVLGPEHPRTLQTMGNLASVLTDETRYAEAEKLDRQTLEIDRRVLGPNHPDTARSTYNLACLAAHEGKKSEALGLLREAVDHGLAPYADVGMDKDPDLKALHGDPRFAALVAHAKEVAAAAQEAK